jgi:hypothetical protein
MRERHPQWSKDRDYLGFGVQAQVETQAEQ